MTAYEIAEALMGLAATSDTDLVEFCVAPSEDEAWVADAVSYKDAEILTCDAGFVLRMNDGSEFQITVVQSR